MDVTDELYQSIVKALSAAEQIEGPVCYCALMLRVAAAAVGAPTPEPVSRDLDHELAALIFASVLDAMDPALRLPGRAYRELMHLVERTAAVALERCAEQLADREPALLRAVFGEGAAERAAG